MKTEKEYGDRYESVLIIDGENAKKAILKCINESAHTIRIRMFMWRDDSAGNLILSALQEKIRSNPDIQIFIEKDAFGSRVYNFQKFIPYRRTGGDIFSSDAGRQFLKNMKNIHFSYIGSRWILLLKYLRENDHSKVFLFDEFTQKSTALIGGMNVADEYLNAQDHAAPNHGGWHDYMVKLTGDLADNIRIGSQKKPKKWIARKIRDRVEIFMTIKNRRTLRNEVLSELSQATTSIVIEQGYLTDAAIIKKLRGMSHYGIIVQVILPICSDGFQHANMHSIYKLLKPSIIHRKWKNAIEIYLYPGMIHAKVILIDQSIAIIGSANLTYGSFDLLHETNVIFRKKSSVISDLGVQLKKDIASSNEVTFETIPPYNRWLAWLESIFI